MHATRGIFSLGLQLPYAIFGNLAPVLVRKKIVLEMMTNNLISSFSAEKKKKITCKDKNIHTSLVVDHRNMSVLAVIISWERSDQ